MMSIDRKILCFDPQQGNVQVVGDPAEEVEDDVGRSSHVDDKHQKTAERRFLR